MAKSKAKKTIDAPDDKQKAIELTMIALEKDHGKGVIMYGNHASFPEITKFSSASIGLDKALGGGYPRGRILEVYGPESSGKTTLALHAIAEVQKEAGICVFIDAEHALDIYYAAELGVDVDNLLISQPDSGEQALKIAEKFARSGAVSLIVIDSVSALVPQKEIEGEIGDASMGQQARLMSQAMRMLVGICLKSNTSILFINQIRMKIGVMFGCFHYDTLVNFTDGRSIPIGQVVDQKIKGKVYSLNPDTRIIQEQLITDWHDNGKAEHSEYFMYIHAESMNGEKFKFKCTSTHKILTNSGWKQACNISSKDKLISKYMNTVNDNYHTEEVSIVEIKTIWAKHIKKKRKFDISVGQNCNYMVGGINNGVLVHNSPETTSGGNALKFYASQRLDIRRIATISEGEEKIGIRTRVKVIKNKVAPPFRQVEFNIIFGKGIDWAMDLLDTSVATGLINKAGAWYSYKEKQLGHGSTKTADFIRKSPELADELRELLLNPPTLPEQIVPEPTDEIPSSD